MSKAYFLRGDSYLRYDGESAAIDSAYPKPLAIAWTGLADAGFGVRLDAAWLKITPAAGVGSGALQPRSRRQLGEDAHATRADQQPDDDQQDAEQHLTANQGHDAADHKYDRNDPQDGCHDVPP
jgi:hypothetical protein